MLRYKNYKVVKPTEYINNQILELINKKEGSVFHEPALNRIIEEKFKTEFYYLVDNPDNINHASVLHITRNKFGLRRYNLRPLRDIPYSGFIGKDHVDFEKFSIGFNESLYYVGFPYYKELNCRSGQTTMIDLSQNEEEIFNKVIHSKRRNMIRKAQRNNIAVEIYNDLSGFDKFWPILRELHEYLGYGQLDYDYYKKIVMEYSRNHQAFTLLAYEKGVTLSGVLILGNSNYMHYYKGATKPGVNNNGQGELLQWEAIKLSKRLGARYYDLCNLNKDKLPEIYRFKTGISDNKFRYPIFTIDPFVYKVTTWLLKSL